MLVVEECCYTAAVVRRAARMMSTLVQSEADRAVLVVHRGAATVVQHRSDPSN